MEFDEKLARRTADHPTPTERAAERVADIDTTNDFLVGRRGEWTTMLLAPPGGVMTRDQALRLAAWLVALSDCERHDFDLVFDAIKAT